MICEKAIRLTQLKEQCEKILDTSLHYRMAANNEVYNIGLKEMSAIKSLRVVDPIILEVLKAVFILLGDFDENLTWEYIRKKLYDSNKLFKAMQDYDCNQPLPETIKERVYPILFEQSISEERIKLICKECLPFYKWALNVVNFFELIEPLIPLKAEYDTLLASPD